MRFEKWQALGNDYLIVEVAELPWTLTAPRIARLCDPHLGVGADGILLLDRSEDPRYVATLRIFNPDGSESELSGNGSREAIMYLRQRGHTDRDEFAILTPAGPVRPRITGPNTCAVDLGRATTTSKDFPSGPPDGAGELVAGGRKWRFQHVSIGNPQCVIAHEDLDGLDPQALGPEIEHNRLFPNRTNVAWYRVIAPDAIRARIFERGVGETLASGTGASGAAVAHHLACGAQRVTVLLDGGKLEVDVAADLNVTLTGWAVPVYEGVLADQLVKELDETQ
ncbi:MAG: diaminopimelate epimerase [Solirubrobacteraceae bacterium]|jgi:diaminopimelate epimerase